MEFLEPQTLAVNSGNRMGSPGRRVDGHQVLVRSRGARPGSAGKKDREAFKEMFFSV